MGIADVQKSATIAILNNPNSPDTNSRLRNRIKYVNTAETSTISPTSGGFGVLHDLINKDRHDKIFNTLYKPVERVKTSSYASTFPKPNYSTYPLEVKNIDYIVPS